MEPTRELIEAAKHFLAWERAKDSQAYYDVTWPVWKRACVIAEAELAAESAQQKGEGE